MKVCSAAFGLFIVVLLAVVGADANVVPRLLGVSPTCLAACGFDAAQSGEFCMRLRVSERAAEFLTAISAVREAQQSLAAASSQSGAKVPDDLELIRAKVSEAKMALASATDLLVEAASAECTPTQRTRLSAWRSVENASLPPELRVVAWDASMLQALKRALPIEHRELLSLTPEQRNDLLILSEARMRVDVVDAQQRLDGDLATFRAAMGF